MDEKQLRFSVYIDPRIPAMIEGDNQRLAQVITNLLSNAAKFTPISGRVKLAAVLRAQADSLCTIRVEVTDSGIGIADADKARLFQAFEQAESGTARKFGGTGLGLAISKRIIEMMGGSIWVESVLGQGASFFFDFRARGRQGAADTLPRLGRMPRILAVDDDQDTRLFFSAVTAQLGLRCDTTGDGGETLALLRKTRDYDVLFVDYSLPDMTGVALIQQMLGLLDKKPHIVLISGLDRSSIEKECQAAGIERFLTKPLFPSDVRSAISGYLGLREGDAPAPPSDGQAEACFAGHKILLAEDIDINREIFFALLDNTGLDIETAENGRIALEKFAADPHAYDMILMDVQMPEMDGHEASIAIRALDIPYAGEVPIIAMTANVFKEDIDRCLASGMVDHIGKPIEQTLLMATLRRYLLKIE
jgi:CheY-like chemotaxis protein